MVKPLPMEQKPQRVYLLDHLRGVALVNMVAYHALYDLVYLFGIDMAWYRSFGAFLWQQAICWTFILVSGATLRYDAKPYRRGAFVLACGLLVTLGTSLAVPQETIYFGILHFMGSAIILTAACRPLLDRIPAWLGCVGCMLLFWLTTRVSRGYVAFWGKKLFFLPEGWYEGWLVYPLGLPDPALYANDYFSLLPWLFLYWAGYFAWQKLEPVVRASAWLQKPIPGLGLIARYSLLIYLAHQPLIYGLLLLLQHFGLL